MNRGPKKQSRTKGQTPFVEKIRDRLDGDAPDWLQALAEMADKNGLRATGERLNYSTAVISNVLNGKYLGDENRVIEIVTGALLGASLACPVLGEIGLDRCKFQQKRPLSTANSQSIRVHYACHHGCPHADPHRGQQS